MGRMPRKRIGTLHGVSGWQGAKMMEDTGKMADIIKIQDRRQPMPSSVPSSLQEAAQPLDQDTAFNELGRCLTLCAPSGMSEDERTTWLATAYAEIADIPVGAFLKATAKARTICDHPSKIIPTILRESEEFAGDLRTISGAKQVETIPHENRLRGPVERTAKPQPIGGETSRILKELNTKAKGERANL